MKRFLLVPAVAVAALAANAEAPAPQLFNGACINALSPDGKIAASEIYGTVQIINLETGDIDEYEYDDMGYPIFDFYIGLGRCISNNGIVTGGTGSGEAEYWKDGEWWILNHGRATNGCLSNGITPDGSRICGSIGLREVGEDGDALMQLPVVWEWTGNGFGAPVILPHPTRDISGRTPQYCTAIEISNDGKTVVGQVVDGFGLMRYPIVYREDETGNWTYEIVHPELLNPNGIAMPEYPGEYEQGIPMIDSYMTEEQIEAFYDALNLWYKENPDAEEMDLFETLVFAEEFMDPEQYAQCMEDVEAYVEWSNALDEWNELYDRICEDSPRYLFNSIHMSPEGDAFSVNVNYGSPYVFSLVSDEYTHYTQFGTKSVSYFASEGRLIVNGGQYSSTSWIIENGKIIDLSEWITAKVPSYGEWMQKNNFLNGIATATPDLGTVGFWEELGDDSMYYARGVVFDIAAGVESGVESTVASPAEHGQAYDIHGHAVKDMTAPGVYIVDGKKVMVTK